MLIPKSALSIRKICDTSSSRFALGGAKFTRGPKGEPLAVATDGHRIVALSWKEDDAAKYPAGVFNPAHNPSFDALIPAAALESAEKLKVPKGRATGLKPILQNVAIDENSADPNKVTFAASDMDNVSRAETKLVEGRFPRWNDCMPALDVDTRHIKVDPRLLREMLEVAEKHCGSDESRSVVISISSDKNGYTRPMVITAASPTGGKFHGVLMPQHFGDPSSKQEPAMAWHACGGKLRMETESELAKLERDMAAEAAGKQEMPAIVANKPAAAVAIDPPAAVELPAAPAVALASELATVASSDFAAGLKAHGEKIRKYRAPRPAAPQPAALKSDWRENARRILCGV